MPRVLLTGGGGFVGTHVHRRLLDRGDTVVVAETDEGLDRTRAGGQAAQLLDAEDLRRALDGGQGALPPEVDAVVHLGAETDTTLADESRYRRNNTDLTVALATVCTRSGTPLVYASSAAVYGASPRCREVPEDEAPLNAYGQSKLDVDLQVRPMLEQGAAVVGLRFFNVYGPGESHKGRMASMVTQLAEQLRRDGTGRLFGASHGVGPGEQQRDFVHVDDVAEVVLWFLDRTDRAGIYNCGTGQPRTFNDLAAAVVAQVGGTVEYVPFPVALTEHYQARTSADLGRLRAAGYPGGFRSLEEGVAQTLSGQD